MRCGCDDNEGNLASRSFFASNLTFFLRREKCSLDKVNSTIGLYIFFNSAIYYSYLI